MQIRNFCYLLTVYFDSLFMVQCILLYLTVVLMLAHHSNSYYLHYLSQAVQYEALSQKFTTAVGLHLVCKVKNIYTVQVFTYF